MKNNSNKFGVSKEWVASAAQTLGRTARKAVNYGALEYAAGISFLAAGAMTRDPGTILAGVAALGFGSAFTINQLSKRKKSSTPTPS